MMVIHVFIQMSINRQTYSIYPMIIIINRTNQMGKKISLVIMLVVIGVQVIHFGYSGKYYNYAMTLDDNNNTSYDNYSSKSTEARYAFAYYVIAACFSVLVYLACILADFGYILLHLTLAYHINLLVFFCQFTLAVLFAIETSSKISPNSPYATFIQTEANYKDTYWLGLAESAITWTICVPGSFYLAFFNEKEAISLPSEQQSGAIA